MEKTIMIDPEKCTSCLICELECAFNHTRECRPSASRISVASWEKVGIATPVLCFQCNDSPCKNVCPTNAIERGADGVVKIDNSLCIKCKACISACPFGCMKFDPVRKEPIKCDQCGGDPACVKGCPSNALLYINSEDVATMKLEKYVSKVRNAEKEDVV